MDDQIEITEFLQNCELFRDFSEEELRKFMPYIRQAEFEKNDWILKEGEEGQSIYVIVSGEVEILKEDASTQELQTVESLSPGDWFGEMAYYEGKHRSASIRAKSHVKALIFSIEDTEIQSLFYSRISHLLAKVMSKRLKKTDQSLVATLNEKLELSRSRVQVSQTLIYTFMFMAVYFNLAKLLDIYGAKIAQNIDLIFFPLSIISCGTLALLVVRNSGYSLAFYGLTLKHWKKNALQAFLVSLPFAAAMVLGKWILIRNFDFFKSENLFNWGQANTNIGLYILYNLSYVVLVPVQELVARGSLQSCFKNFFQGPNRALSAIITSNLAFEIIHTTFDIWLAVFSLLFGLLWGFLYDRQKSLVGPVVSHLFIGWVGFFPMNLPNLLKAWSQQ